MGIDSIIKQYMSDLKKIITPIKLPASKTYYQTIDILKSIPEILSGNFKNSESVRNFENKFADFCNARYSYALPSARVCLYYIFKALNLPADSEVILTPITIADIVNMILCNNLQPRFADMNIKTLNYSVESLKKNITLKTKVVIITYLYGFIPPDLDEIINIAKRHNLIIIEDFSQALGAKYDNKNVGTFGDFGIYSLSSFKTCSALFGGMIISNNAKVINEIRTLSQKELAAPKRQPFLIMTFKIILHKFLNCFIVYSYFTFYFYSIVNKINPKILYILQTGNIGVLLGLKKVDCYNKIKKELLFNFTDFQAEIGMNNLKQVTKINNQLKKLFDNLKNAPAINNNFPFENNNVSNVYWRIPLYCENQIETMSRLLCNNIETSLSALPLCSAEECFKRFNINGCSNAEKIYNTYLLLPSFSDMNEKQLKYLKQKLLEMRLTNI